MLYTRPESQCLSECMFSGFHATLIAAGFSSVSAKAALVPKLDCLNNPQLIAHAQRIAEKRPAMYCT